jgi:hypothetical protein
MISKPPFLARVSSHFPLCNLALFIRHSERLCDGVHPLNIYGVCLVLCALYCNLYSLYFILNKFFLLIYKKKREKLLQKT